MISMIMRMMPRLPILLRSASITMTVVVTLSLLLPVVGQTQTPDPAGDPHLDAEGSAGAQVYLPLIVAANDPAPAPTGTPTPRPTSTPTPRPTSTPVIPPGDKTWPMLAANLERTSWTPEEVRGNLAVDWYLPIEPYIPYKIQPIAANGRIYVSTARGLYSVDATNGNIDWVYATELPLGHSPTIATVNGNSVAYVGGYDRKIHALSAITGEPMPGYTAYIAEAGFETNPLVIDNTIYAGNRDGFFYALDAVTGAIKWRYQTEGPIPFSAAYKDGVLYFASNDARAYALNADTGSLVWKSDKLPGQSFHSYWPVIYTDSKVTGKSYVIFSGSENYRTSEEITADKLAANYFVPGCRGLPGPACPADVLWTGSRTTGDPFWPDNTFLFDVNEITEYHEKYPQRRSVFVLDRLTGQEFLFDSDGDGKLESAPFTWTGATNSGSRYPAVVNGVDNIYYQNTLYWTGYIPRGDIVGWKFGTHFVSRVATGNAPGAVIGHAADEPMAQSSGGRLIYWNLCCDREGGAFDVTIPFGEPDRDWHYWGYSMGHLAPGYQAMYNDGDTDLYNNMNGWQIYSGKVQSKNGVYGKHGTTQSPPIPYLGRLYTLKGNALVAWSPTNSVTGISLPLAPVMKNQIPANAPSPTEVQRRLESEVNKMLSAGHLRAGYHSAGFIDTYSVEFGEIFDYFQNPSDTLVTLLQAMPYLSHELQSQVKIYLQSNYGPGSKYDFTRVVHVGYGTGAPREAFELPPEEYVQNNPDGMGAPYRSPLDPSERPTCGGDPANGYACGYWFWFPPYNFYAAWKYASVFGNAKPIFDSMKGKIEAFPSSDSARYANLSRRPYLLHQYIAGYQGYLELQKIAGYTEDANVKAWYIQALDLRMNGFSKDTPFSGGPESMVAYYNRSLSVARNFMFLTPEIADYMNFHLKTQVQQAVDEYNYVAPYWFVAGFDNTVGEGTLQHLYDYPAIFQAKAYILKDSYTDVAKYLDAPAFQKGDLFHIQNLVAALSAADR